MCRGSPRIVTGPGFFKKGAAKPLQGAGLPLTDARSRLLQTLGDFGWGEPREEREMKDLAVACGELAQGATDALPLLGQDEVGERVVGFSATRAFGYSLEPRGALAGAECIRDHMAGDPSNELPETLAPLHAPRAYGSYGARQRLLCHFLSGFRIPERPQGHDLEPGPQPLEVECQVADRLRQAYLCCPARLAYDCTKLPRLAGQNKKVYQLWIQTPPIERNSQALRSCHWQRGVFRS